MSNKSNQLPKMPAPRVEGEGLDVPTHLDDLTGANGLSKHADAILNPEKSPEDDEAFAKPGYEQAAASKSHVKARLPSGTIEVVAMRKGFYNQQRYEEGDKFLIRSEDDLGEWMKCVDASKEKHRVELFRKKKLDARKRQLEAEEG